MDGGEFGGGHGHLEFPLAGGIETAGHFGEGVTKYGLLYDPEYIAKQEVAGVAGKMG